MVRKSGKAMVPTFIIGEEVLVGFEPEKVDAALAKP